LQSKRKGCVFELDRGFHKTFLGKAECRETVLGAFIESEFFVSQSSVFWLLLSQTSLFHRDDREDIEGSGTWGLIKNIKQLGCRVSSFSHLAKKKTKKKNLGGIHSGAHCPGLLHLPALAACPGARTLCPAVCIHLVKLLSSGQKP
jgi:hypothetical protein